MPGETQSRSSILIVDDSQRFAQQLAAEVEKAAADAGVLLDLDFATSFYEAKVKVCESEAGRGPSYDVAVIDWSLRRLASDDLDMEDLGERLVDVITNRLPNTQCLLMTGYDAERLPPETHSKDDGKKIARAAIKLLVVVQGADEAEGG